MTGETPQFTHESAANRAPDSFDTVNVLGSSPATDLSGAIAKFCVMAEHFSDTVYYAQNKDTK